MKKFFSNDFEKIYIFFGVFFILSLYIPYLIFNEKSFIGIPFDYLNSNVVWLKIIKDSGAEFARNCTSVFPSIMNQPRVSYGSEINFIYLLFKLFSPFCALVINNLFITLTAFFSFYQLLNYSLKNLPALYKSILSLTFALLPFWQFGGISIAGFPYLFVIMNMIWTNKPLKFYHYLFIFIYPFYSSFVIFTVFNYLFLFIYFVVKFFLEKKINLRFIFIFIFLILASIICEYRMFLFILEPCFVSNRSVLYSNVHLSLDRVFELLRFSNQHAPPLHFPILYILLLFAMIFLNKKIFREKLFLIIVITLFIAELLSSNIFTIVFNTIFQIKALKGFSFHRFNVINQILWYFLSAYLLYKIFLEKKRIPTIIVSVLILLQFLFVLKSNTIFKNVIHKINKNYYSFVINFSDYYMIDEYKKIVQILPGDKKKYKLLHYGFDPATSSYNGYSTADGFLAFYDLNYEKSFDSLIKPIISQNETVFYKRPFHNYIITERYSAGINYLQTYSKKPFNLKLDFTTLKKLGATHILSTVKFTNKEFIEIGNVKSSYWRNVYVYKIDWVEP